MGSFGDSRVHPRVVDHLCPRVLGEISYSSCTARVSPGILGCSDSTFVLRGIGWTPVGELCSTEERIPLAPLIRSFRRHLHLPDSSARYGKEGLQPNDLSARYDYGKRPVSGSGST